MVVILQVLLKKRVYMNETGASPHFTDEMTHDRIVEPNIDNI